MSDLMLRFPDRKSKFAGEEQVRVLCPNHAICRISWLYGFGGPSFVHAMLKLADGRLVACAFQLYPPEKATMMKPEDRELVIKDPKCDKVYDMFGAELKATDKRKLDVAPVWYIGLDPNCEWLKQCPIDLEPQSAFFVRNVSGEPIPLHLSNPDLVEYRVELPESMRKAGWKVRPRDYGYDVVGPLGAPREANQFRVVGKNGGVEKVMYVDIDIITQAYAKSNVEQFDRTFKVNVVNQSATNQVYELRSNLPAGWEVSPSDFASLLSAQLTQFPRSSCYSQGNRPL